MTMRIEVSQNNRDNQDIILAVKTKVPTEAEKREQEKAQKEQAKADKKRQDQITISNEARELQEQMEQARESGKAQAEEMEKKSKCILISGRVAAGDKVPAKDLQYLMKNDPELYAQAMKLRIPKEDPKEWDSLTGDEEEGEQGETTSGSGTNVSAAGTVVEGSAVTMENISVVIS